MNIEDAGHSYLLRTFDGEGMLWRLQFVKRIGERYPGNMPPAYPGTITQEVLRALIDRAKYVNRQIPCAETEAAIGLLSAALLLFEIRTKRVKSQTLNASHLYEIVEGEPCQKCGHILCDLHEGVVT